MTCPNCKNSSKIKKNFGFCPYCGQRLVEPSSLIELTARVEDLEKIVLKLSAWKERKEQEPIPNYIPASSCRDKINISECAEEVEKRLSKMMERKTKCFA